MLSICIGEVVKLLSIWHFFSLDLYLVSYLDIPLSVCVCVCVLMR